MAAVLAAVLALAAACAEGHAAPDDAAAHSAVAAGRAGAEITFDATLLQEPVRAGSHERMQVSDPAGDRLEIDHNVDLAGWVPAHAGEMLVIRGRLYDDGGREGVHCTHGQTSRGCPEPGFIERAGTYYE